MHCAVDDGFELAGLEAVRKNYEARGYETILVDDRDAIQGEPIGMLTQGEAIIDLMNSMKYDVAIPGNHEFDYGMQRFLELKEKAEYPYISCNITRDGKALDPEATYTVSGQDYHLLNHGDGYTMFDGARSVIMTGRLDSEVLSDYIKDTLGGEIGADYAELYGQGRITIIQ